MNIQNQFVGERLDIDPCFQGIWQLRGILLDDGTVKKVKAGEMDPFCRAFATKIKLADGGELVVERVLVIYSREGRMVNVIDFLNTPLQWWVTDVRDLLSQGGMLAVLNSAEQNLEHLKFVFTVQV